MGGNGRKLGWIAIGLGVIALLVALAGHGRSQTWPAGMAQVPYPPSAKVGPRGWMGPQQGVGPQQGFGPQQDMGPRGNMMPPGGWDFQSRMRPQPGFMGPGHFNFGPFFFLPFILFGGLVRSLLFLLLIFLAVRFFRRKGAAGQPGKPGPEQPPYTGETQNL